jgi:peptidoglycan/xylan/chitin deacetylase (PgdA/CDA1 family)
MRRAAIAATMLALACAGAVLARQLAQVVEGGIVRGPVDRKLIALEFTGHEFAEGGTAILDELARHHASASFFLTGDFLRRAEFAAIARRIAADGHYLGPHSDKHLQYCSWEAGRKTLVTKDALRRDLDANVREIERFGVPPKAIRYWVPAYEWYNGDIAAWSAKMGLQLVNLTPGTKSSADYTGEADTNFVRSQDIFDSILTRERSDPDGLNGFLLLMHIGAGPGRMDKMHDRLGGLLDALIARGYRFVRIDELLRSTSAKG